MVIGAVYTVNIGEPLEGGGGPLERVQNGEVVLVGCFLLPDFVLLVYDHLFLLVVLCVE